MTAVHVLMAILAAWRLTEIVTQEQIFAGIRQWWANRFGTTRYGNFLTCTRCVSVWTGGIATVVFMVYPLLNWPFALSLMFGLYGLVLQHLTLAINHNQRRITIYPDQQKVDRGGFDEMFAINTMRSAATMMEQTVNGKHKAV